MKCDCGKHWSQYKEMVEILDLHEVLTPPYLMCATFRGFQEWLELGRPVLAKRLKIKNERT